MLSRSAMLIFFLALVALILVDQTAAWGRGGGYHGGGGRGWGRGWGGYRRGWGGYRGGWGGYGWGGYYGGWYPGCTWTYGGCYY